MFEKIIEKWGKEGRKPNRMKMDNINYIKIGIIIELVFGYFAFKYLGTL